MKMHIFIMLMTTSLTTSVMAHPSLHFHDGGVPIFQRHVKGIHDPHESMPVSKTWWESRDFDKVLGSLDAYPATGGMSKLISFSVLSLSSRVPKSVTKISSSVLSGNNKAHAEKLMVKVIGNIPGTDITSVQAGNNMFRAKSGVVRVIFIQTDKGREILGVTLKGKFDKMINYLKNAGF